MQFKKKEKKSGYDTQAQDASNGTATKDPILQKALELAKRPSLFARAATDIHNGFASLRESVKTAAEKAERKLHVLEKALTTRSRGSEGSWATGLVVEFGLILSFPLIVMFSAALSLPNPIDWGVAAITALPLVGNYKYAINRREEKGGPGARSSLIGNAADFVQFTIGLAWRAALFFMALTIIGYIPAYILGKLTGVWPEEGGGIKDFSEGFHYNRPD